MDLLIAIGAALVGWATAALGWLRWLHELREKRREKTAKEKAEATLREISRRAPALSPYFAVSNKRFNSLSIPSENSPNRRSISFGGGLLCFMGNEVGRDLPAGDWVYLAIANHGGDAYEISIDIDGAGACLIDGKTGEGDQLMLIRYPFGMVERGVDQTIKVRFLRSDGVRDEHVYTTQHGRRVLKRIDPA